MKPIMQQSTLDFIALCEGFKSNPYTDGTGRWTIGIGFTTLNGQSVNASTPPMTLQEAESILKDQVQQRASFVSDHVTVSINQNQYDAICDFTYNLGIESLLISELLKNINAGLQVTQENFTDWDNQTVNGKLVKVEGLYDRRLKEFNLFNS